MTIFNNIIQSLKKIYDSSWVRIAIHTSSRIRLSIRTLR